MPNATTYLKIKYFGQIISNSTSWLCCFEIAVIANCNWNHAVSLNWIFFLLTSAILSVICFHRHIIYAVHTLQNFRMWGQNYCLRETLSKFPYLIPIYKTHSSLSVWALHWTQILKLAGVSYYYALLDKQNWNCII